MTFILFIVGLAILVGGAELLVRGASRLALMFGISPLLVGFLGYYIAYVCYLVLNGQQHDALLVFNAVMLWFAIPLTVLTLAVLSLRAMRVPKPG